MLAALLAKDRCACNYKISTLRHRHAFNSNCNCAIKFFSCLRFSLFFCPSQLAKKFLFQLLLFSLCRFSNFQFLATCDVFIYLFIAVPATFQWFKRYPLIKVFYKLLKRSNFFFFLLLVLFMLFIYLLQ